MSLREPATYLYLFVLLILLLIGCQKKNNIVEDHPDEQGRKHKRYVKAIMTHFVAPSQRNADLLPPPPIGWSYLTVGATYEGDTLRIMLDTVKELVDLSTLAGAPTDSASIASVVKGENLLNLNEKAFGEASIIKPLASIDSVRSQGRQYTLKHYFKESGYQKVHLSPSEQDYLIDALSGWGILVYWDDYIGTYLIVE
jgi:hypothetical protein